MIHSMISVFGVHFDDSDKCEKEKLGERFYHTEFFFFYFSINKRNVRNKYDTFIITSGDPQLEDNW